MLVYLFLATLATITALPIGVPNTPHVCPDKETWYACGACEATCSEPNVACPLNCHQQLNQGRCGCIQGLVREPKDHRCVPRNECPRIGHAELHPVPADLRPVPDEIRPVGPMIVQTPVCPDKEMYFHCGACDRSCSGVQPNCPKLCQEKGSCGCIEGHVREAKGPRCIPETECNIGVGPAEIHPPVPAEIRPVAEEIVPPVAAIQRPVPAWIRPVPEEIVPPVVPGESHPQLCPDREVWLPCGACDGSCSEPTRVCDRMCQSKGSCGCIKDHVREPKGHGCIHVKNCPNSFIPLEIHS